MIVLMCLKDYDDFTVENKTGVLQNIERLLRLSSIGVIIMNVTQCEPREFQENAKYLHLNLPGRQVLTIASLGSFIPYGVFTYPLLKPGRGLYLA